MIFEDGDRLLFYTVLNRHGRDTLLERDASPTVSDLVMYLCNAHEDNDPLFSPSMKVNVHFWILSLDPTLWTGTITSVLASGQKGGLIVGESGV